MKILEFLTSIFSIKKAAIKALWFHKFIDSGISSTKETLSNINTNYFGTLSIGSIIIALKFLLSIALLIFIRGGLPRYRFDHLTKVGWVKFLTVVVCFLLIELLFLYTVFS